MGHQGTLGNFSIKTVNLRFRLVLAQAIYRLLYFYRARREKNHT